MALFEVEENQFNTTVLTSSDNLNNIKNYGLYSWAASSLPINSPTQYKATMYISRIGGSTSVLQITYDELHIFQRSYTDGVGWDDWRACPTSLTSNDCKFKKIDSNVGSMTLIRRGNIVVADFGSTIPAGTYNGHGHSSPSWLWQVSPKPSIGMHFYGTPDGGTLRPMYINTDGKIAFMGAGTITISASTYLIGTLMYETDGTISYT